MNLSPCSLLKRTLVLMSYLNQKTLTSHCKAVISTEAVTVLLFGHPIVKSDNTHLKKLQHLFRRAICFNSIAIDPLCCLLTVQTDLMPVVLIGLLLGWRWARTVLKWQSTTRQKAQSDEESTGRDGGPTADCDAYHYPHLWRRWDIFMTQYERCEERTHCLPKPKEICETCLCGSTAEKINSIWIPSKHKREAWNRVFSWRLQLWSQRDWRAARCDYRTGKAWFYMFIL